MKNNIYTLFKKINFNCIIFQININNITRYKVSEALYSREVRRTFLEYNKSERNKFKLNDTLKTF